MVSIFASILVVGALHSLPQPTFKYESPNPIVIECESTAYCMGTKTATGKPVREGLCAMSKDYIGMTAVVYDSETMECIGIFEVEDTGGDERIKAGKCIDIYNPSYEWCINYGRKKVIVYLYDAEG